MKQIATEEVINYWLSNIEFHFETPHPIDDSFMSEIIKAEPSQRAGSLGALLELLNAMAAYEPEPRTSESYSRIRREATKQVFSHVDHERLSNDRTFRTIKDDNELNRILGELAAITMQYAYDYDAQKYWATYQDLSDKFLMLVAEELFLLEDSMGLEQLGFIIMQARENLDTTLSEYPGVELNDLSLIDGSSAELYSSEIQKCVRPLIGIIEKSRDFVFDDQTLEVRQATASRAMVALVYAAASEFEEIPHGMSLQTLFGSAAVVKMCDLIDGN